MKLKTFSLLLLVVLLGTTGFNAVAQDTDFEIIYQRMYERYLDKSPSQTAVDKLLQIIRIGLPAGIQGAVFNISNVLIQSSINSFGSVAMAGNTAASNIEGFVYTAMNALYQAATSFTSQNVGARKTERIVPVLLSCLGIVTVVGASLSSIVVAAADQLLGIYSSDPEVISYGISRLHVVCLTYFTCGLMDVACGSIRGLGYSIAPTIVSLAGACGLRILWIYTVFRLDRTLFTLYLSYPVSWIVTFACHIVCFIVFFVFGYMLYASLFAAIGSAVESEGDTQQLQIPLTVPLLLAFFIALYAFKAPDSGIVFWGSIIPFTSPIVMLARLPFGVPVWEIVLSVVLLVATFAVFAWFSAKIYKVGILMFGKKSTWKDLWKWFKQK